jgi:hypothetical protein
MDCCGKSHAWDTYDVPNRWKPQQRVRCLIVGENPGKQNSVYFYDVPANHDPVRVRTNLLHGLMSGARYSFNLFERHMTSNAMIEYEQSGTQLTSVRE